jgi:hypothetical protein
MHGFDFLTWSGTPGKESHTFTLLIAIVWLFHNAIKT